MCERCATLEHNLARLRDAFERDKANWATELTGALKERDHWQSAHDRLQAEFDKAVGNTTDRDNTPRVKASDRSKRATLLVKHWKKACGKKANTAIPAGGKRWKVALAALERTEDVERELNPDGYDIRAFKRCLKAIDGLASRPFAGPRGRSAEQYPGAKRYDDVEHALGDEKRQEQCEGYVDEPNDPTPPTGHPSGRPPSPSAPAGAARQPLPPDDDYRHMTRHMKQHHLQSDWQHPLDVFGAFLDNLEQRGYTVRRRGDHQASAQCPAHDDHHPSLDITWGRDGKVLMICRSHGCTAEDVCATVDWPLRWLFPLSQVATDDRARQVAIEHEARGPQLWLVA